MDSDHKTGSPGTGPVQIIPVLAHAERYLCLRETGRTEELVQSGACLQVNAESLTGGLFDRTAAWCLKEIQKGGSTLPPAICTGRIQGRPRLEEAFKKLSKKRSCPDAATIFGKNQRYILENKVL